jgi:hypothetical protein
MADAKNKIKASDIEVLRLPCEGSYRSDVQRQLRAPIHAPQLPIKSYATVVPVAVL